MNNKNYRYIYVISAYEGGRGYVAQSVYKMNDNTEEMRTACQEDFKKDHPEAIYYMHLCSSIVIEIKDIGIDTFIKDGDICCKKYQEEQKKLEAAEREEYNRLKKKFG